MSSTTWTPPAVASEAFRARRRLWRKGELFVEEAMASDIILFALEGSRAFGEKVSATTTAGATSGYNVPMLKVAGMKRGEDTQVKVNFTGAMTGARANFNIEPRKDGPTMITARFHELKEAPAGQVYVLWAVSPDNKFVKLGQIVNTGGRNEAEIKSETTLPEFGLLVTAEEGAPKDDAAMPRGAVVGTIVP